jgi:hypothetical protein
MSALAATSFLNANLDVDDAPQVKFKTKQVVPTSLD